MTYSITGKDSKKSKKANKKASRRDKKKAHVEALRVIAQAKVTEGEVLKDCVEKILELMARAELSEKAIELLKKATGVAGPKGETGARGERGEKGGFSIFS